MRILLYCDEDLGVAAGGSRQIWEIAKALAGRGHDTRIVAPEPSRVPGECEAGLARLQPVSVVRGGGLRPWSFLLRSVGVLRRTMSKWRPDVFLWFDSPGQLAPLWALRGQPSRVIYFVNGLPEEEVQGVWRWGPLRRCLSFGLAWAARRADVVVSVCPELLGTLQARRRIALRQSAVIRNGVDPARFRPQSHGDARKRLGLQGSGPYIGFVGGFFPWHGLDLLVEAIPLVAQTYPHVEFLLVGDGQTREATEALVRERKVAAHVRFVGRAEYDLVPTWIAACDVCVVLHKPLRSYPGDSMKLWEYLACGRPVVTTAGAGYGETIEALGAGVAAEPDNPTHLAEQLVHVLGDAELRANMGARGRAAVLQEHTWDARAAQLEAVCHRVAPVGVQAA